MDIHNCVNNDTDDYDKTNFFDCEFCNYLTNKRSNYERHLKSQKHKKHFNVSTCCRTCNKIFETKSGLWKHNKKYHPNNQIMNNVGNINTGNINGDNVVNLLNNIVHTARELISSTTEKSNISNNGNNNINNSNNRFNINFYLNDTCKNAMNINEFSDSINVTMDDLEQTSKLGFVDGISRIIIKNLKEIDESDRPMHCSDSKRVILYIKSDDSWSKNNNEKLVTLIKNVAGKNMKQIYEWQKLNPNYSDPTSNCSDKYQHMLFQVMSGDSIEECNSNIDKIIKNIAKETMISKEKYS